MAQSQDTKVLAKAKNIPLRGDHVGSLLHPERIKQARLTYLFSFCRASAVSLRIVSFKAITDAI
ncbi:hypothetical protein [Sediminibacillus albus]|uniref:Uncharacterized protein n=1 Tax=Sediminibacillus albus TaxID=407036 RepID=A0A1G8WRV7_9BACI|nr:hypothetical protein [Sediminibacillus albus]SDJ80806.1 hypothetical protein SAMN05216243_0951 [Sediminibacillus albus]